MKRLTVLGLLVLSLLAFYATTPTVSASPSLTSDTSGGYSCPPYSRYCRKDADCRGYCGTGTPPEWEICEFGCCACLG